MVQLKYHKQEVKRYGKSGINTQIRSTAQRRISFISRKEQAYISAITKLTEKNSSLEEEVSDLRQQLALLKKALYGQKSEKTEVIMENAEQLTMFNEAENLIGKVIPFSVCVKQAVSELMLNANRVT